MSTCTVKRSAALKVFTFCSWKSAGNWDCARMATKLKDVKEVLPSGEAPEEIKAVLTDILTTIDEGGTFEVIDDSAEGAPAEAAASSGDGEAAAATDAPKAAKAPKTPKEPKPPKAPKEPKPPKEPKAPKEPSHPTSRKDARVYCCGIVLKRHGLGAVLTEEMAKEVDDLCGKPNTKESMAWLKLIWQGINGYTQEFPAAD